MSSVNAAFLCAFAAKFLESLHPDINDPSHNLSDQWIYFSMTC